MKLTDKSIASGGSHDSGTASISHSNNVLKNAHNKFNRHNKSKSVLSETKKKTERFNKKKPRKGKSLLDDNRSPKEIVELTETKAKSENEKSGVRTISVREWLRRG